LGSSIACLLDVPTHRFDEIIPLLEPTITTRERHVGVELSRINLQGLLEALSGKIRFEELLLLYFRKTHEQEHALLLDINCIELLLQHSNELAPLLNLRENAFQAPERVDLC